MAALSPSAGTGTTQQETHVVADQSSTEPDISSLVASGDVQQSHDITWPSQPQNEVTDNSQDTAGAANAIQNESAPAQKYEASKATTPPLDPPRDSQEARSLDLKTKSQLQPEADNIDGDENGVQTGEHYPMSLDVDSQDSDSAIGMEMQSSTMSLRSSLYEYVEENGRTYHKYKEGSYYLPNDEVEQSRLDLQHHLFLLTLNGQLSLAPISNPQYVLDIGTGTGIWAIEYASQHPEASVTGVDLSPIQPEYVPPNCQFEVDDVEDDWTYSRKPDYVHGRAMFSCFKDPKVVFQKAYEALAPGGYFEMQDVHFKLHSNDGTTYGTSIEKWTELLIQGAAKIGRDWDCTPKYAQWFKEVGFEDVVENKFAWPVNTWPKGRKQKTMGLWMLTNALEGMNAISMAMMTRSLGMPAEEVELMLVDVRRDAKDKAIHAYYPVYVVYGRKPL